MTPELSVKQQGGKDLVEAQERGHRHIVDACLEIEGMLLSVGHGVSRRTVGTTQNSQLRARGHVCTWVPCDKCVLLEFQEWNG